MVLPPPPEAWGYRMPFDPYDPRWLRPPMDPGFPMPPHFMPPPPDFRIPVILQFWANLLLIVNFNCFPFVFVKTIMSANDDRFSRWSTELLSMTDDIFCLMLMFL